MTLSFSTIACPRCGARRHTRFPCPDCGKAAAPTEIDPNVQARQRAVQDATSAMSKPVDRIESNAMELLESGGLAELPKRVFGAADRLAGGEADGAGKFAAVASEIAALESWAKEVILHRPLVTLTRRTQSVIRSLIQVYDVVAAALIEERLDEAQRATDLVQRALDAAADEAAQATAVLQRAARVLNAADPVGAWVAEAFEGDPIAAAARGQALLEARTGRTGGPGSGLTAVFYDSALSTIGDPDEFWRLVTAHLQLLDTMRAEIPVLVSDPLFSSRLSEVIHDLWEAARRAAVAPQAETLRAAATEFLEAGHLLAEQPLKFHLGVACAATTRMTFADTQASDVSQLINIVNDKGWEIGSRIGDSDVRNAFAHRDFAVVGDEVSLSPQRRRRSGATEIRVPINQVQDVVLSLVETVSAMDLALAVAMDEIGVGVHPSPVGRIIARPLLAGLGWSEVSIVEERTLVTISAVTDGAVPLSTIVFAAQPFTGSAERLLLHLVRPDTGAQSDIELDLEAYALWANAIDELEKEAAFARLGRATLVNGLYAMNRGG